MASQPLIGITSGRRTTERGVEILYAIPSYVQAVAMAGGLPVIIPITAASLRTLYTTLDGIVLSGGGDVLPARYGAEPIPQIYGTDDLRDTTEIALVRWAAADDKPLLAICRGHQVLNVALGGTLYRHIPGDIETVIQHDNPLPTHRAQMIHDIRAEPNSLLAKALGTTESQVNSMHHQAVDRLGEGLRIVAHAPDGVIEGIEHPDRRFVLGVQWHPEEIQSSPPMRRLFQHFVQTASNPDRI